MKCIARLSVFNNCASMHVTCSHCRFRIDNTDHIIDVNQGRNPNNPMEYDQVNILCPLYEENRTADIERYVIYHVNREEYDMCRIMTAHPRVIARCDAPYSLRYYTISFRSFSPTPGALEFHAGKDYYFISTSAPDDIHLRAGGMCRTHNMKLVFKVSDGKKQAAAKPVKEADNQLLSPPPSFNEIENKERKRRRKNQETTLGPFSYMNEDPKFRQKEPSHVEKVNNLMKQEASIFAGGANSARKGLAAIFLSSFLLILV